MTKNAKRAYIDTSFLAVSTTIENYHSFDKRSMKPVILKDINECLILERLAQIKTRMNRRIVKYIPPNPIALQLDVVKNCINEMKAMDMECLIAEIADNEEASSSLTMDFSKKVYDYLALIHKAIIFSYTSIETFVNLSIPESYNYNVKKNKEGITEIYDKNGIERWLPLAVKLKNILVPIYNTPEIHKQPFWQDFLILEKYRNQIIHQKSSDRTILYENYFHKDIYKNIKASSEIVDFFRVNAKSQGVDNILWPWTENESSNEIPYIEDIDNFLKYFKIVP